MRPGTPGFVGARLVEARDARGITAVGLADMIGVKRQAVSQFENDSSTPHPEKLREICDRLSLPAKFFVTPIGNRPRKSPFFYRSMSSAGVRQRRRASVYHQWLYDLTQFVCQYVEIPAPNFPVLSIPDDPRKLAMSDIDDLATSVRRHWKMGDGPISDLILLLENNGAIISRMDLDMESLDGLSAWYDTRPFIITSTHKESAARSRFDVAHELGHLLLHRAVTDADLNDGGLFKLVEQQAHRFAAAFLFPQKSFALEVHPITLDHLVDLKRRWRVSVGMMLYRLPQFGFQDSRQMEQLWRRYSYNKWKTDEPLDRELVPERPRILQRSIDMILRSGVVDKEEFLTRSLLRTHEVEQLASLPEKYFSDERAEVVAIQPRLRAQSPDAAAVPISPESGKVIAFRRG